MTKKQKTEDKKLRKLMLLHAEWLRCGGCNMQMSDRHVYGHLGWMDENCVPEILESLALSVWT